MFRFICTHFESSQKLDAVYEVPRGFCAGPWFEALGKISLSLSGTVL